MTTDQEKSAPLLNLLKTLLKIIKNNKKLFFTCVFIFYAFWIPLLFVFHEPWRDESQAWLLVRDCNFLQLLSQLKYEAHPIGWYLIIWPFAKLGAPFDAMRIVHGIITFACAGLICFKLRCNFFVKLLYLFASPLFYEFSAISRNYSIGILALLSLANWYDERYASKKYHCAVCLFVLFNSNLYAAVIGIALTGGEIFLALYGKVVEKKPLFKKNERFGAIIFFSSAAISLILIYAVCVSSWFERFNPIGNYDIYDYGLQKDLSIYDSVKTTLKALLSTLSGNSFNSPASYIVILFFLLIIVWNGKDFKSKLYCALATLAAIVGTAALRDMVGRMGSRHIAALAFLPLFFLHINFSAWSNEAKLPKSATSICAFLLFLSFYAGFWGNYKNAKSDFEKTYSENKFIAQFLINYGYDEDDVLVISSTQYADSTIKAYINNVKTFRCLVKGISYDLSYAAWQLDGAETDNPENLLDFVKKQTEYNRFNYRAIIFLSSSEDDYQKLNYRLIYRSPRDAIVADESLDAYLTAKNGVITSVTNYSP